MSLPLFQQQDEIDEIKKTKLKVNREFAKRFEERKKREQLEKGKAQYGNNFINEDDEESDSSSDDEDEVGELITEKINNKFLETIAKIRQKNPDIYDEKKKFFKEKDFQINEKSSSNKQKTVKDMIREDVLQKMNKEQISEEDISDSSKEIDPKQKKFETPYAEQQRIKDEFKKAAQAQSQKDSNTGDDIFQIKKKTKQEIAEEKEWQNQQIKHKNIDQELFQKYWVKEDNMDETDKFLKNYILNKQYIDQDDIDSENSIDKEDEQRDEEMEMFEQKYNFRFEEPEGTELITYARNIPDTLRQKDDKRIQKRNEQKERKKQIKEKAIQDIKQLKNIQKDLIKQRLEKIQKISGITNKNLDALEQIVDDDFDEKTFDKQMQKQFGEDYYEENDDQEEELKMYEQLQNNKMEQEQAIKDQEKENQELDKDNVTDVKLNIPLGNKRNINEKEIELMQEDQQDQDNRIFWYCDKCLKGIPANQFRYDCLQCPDYTLCHKCNSAQVHEHKLKKFIVPNNCSPPEDKQIQKILKQFKICNRCSQKLNEYCDYYELKSNNEFILCEDCFDGENLRKKEDLYTLVGATKIDMDEVIEQNPQKFTKLVDDKVLNSLVEEYYNLDFEDLIAGEIKTRFKYIDQVPESYGLSNDQLLYTDPKLLNQFVPLNKLAPYREDQGKVRSKNLKNKVKLHAIQKSAKQVKSLLKKENLKVEEIYQKMSKLKNKPKHTRKMKMLKRQMTTLTKNNENIIQFQDSVNKKLKRNEYVLENEEQDNTNNKLNLKLSKDRLQSYGIN